MAEEMKTGNTNPEHECQMNPNDAQVAQIIAPVGSFWWALVQLKQGRNVRRRDWVEKEQLNFVPRKTDIDGQFDYLSHMDKRNQHGNWAPWQAAQEDLLACDWALIETAVKPEPELEADTLVFDLTSGNYNRADSFLYTHYYGCYSDKKGYQILPDIFGEISVIQNTTAIEKIFNFMWGEKKDSFSASTLFMRLGHKQRADNFRALLQKELHITVEGVVYNLGRPTAVSDSDPDGKYDAVYYGVNMVDGQKFSELLKQTGQTKRFYCQWR